MPLDGLRATWRQAAEAAFKSTDSTLEWSEADDAAADAAVRVVLEHILKVRNERNSQMAAAEADLLLSALARTCEAAEVEPRGGEHDG